MSRRNHKRAQSINQAVSLDERALTCSKRLMLSTSFVVTATAVIICQPSPRAFHIRCVSFDMNKFFFPSYTPPFDILIFHVAEQSQPLDTANNFAFLIFFTITNVFSFDNFSVLSFTQFCPFWYSLIPLRRYVLCWFLFINFVLNLVFLMLILEFVKEYWYLINKSMSSKLEAFWNSRLLI